VATLTLEKAAAKAPASRSRARRCQCCACRGRFGMRSPTPSSSWPSVPGYVRREYKKRELCTSRVQKETLLYVHCRMGPACDRLGCEACRGPDSRVMPAQPNHRARCIFRRRQRREGAELDLSNCMIPTEPRETASALSLRARTTDRQASLRNCGYPHAVQAASLLAWGLHPYDEWFRG